MVDVKDPKELLAKAENSLRIADHMVYITYPLLKESRLLQKIIDQLSEVAMNIIEASLSYEYIFKRLLLPQSREQYFDMFRTKCSASFGIAPAEMQVLKELFDLIEKHKNSPFEFSRKDKLVIMSNGFRTDAINLEKLKKYLNTLKVVLQKTKTRINKPLI
ncbi:MAG: hypothetical protein K6T16_00385 [Candidatus Pacearchaeota archaeon]|nr:hypothetical protein [Candidatus Pacearchaeota archaeon]